MLNQVTGIAVIILCSIGYFYSWKIQAKDKFTVSILLLIICGAVLRMYVSADFFLHPWDERYHALVAKNFINHPLIPTLYDNPALGYDYKEWSLSHFWLHKQPLPLWAMAVSMYLFGITEIALRIPSIILTSLGIGLTFSIGSYLYDRKIGYLAAFFYSINGLIIEMTSGRIATDHIDVFFLFFVELAVFFLVKFIQKKEAIYNLLTGISIGAAILCKWMPALIVLPIWLLLIADAKKFTVKSTIIHFIVLLLTTIAVFLPWQLYIYHTFPLEAGWEAGFNQKHFTQVLEGHAGNVFYYLNAIRINYNDLIYLPLLWLCRKLYKQPNDLKSWAIFVWLFVPMVFFTIAKTKMQGYILFISPALFLLTADFWHWLLAYKNQHQAKWLITLLLVLLIALPIRYTIERTKPFTKTNRQVQWAGDLKQLNSKNYTNAVLLNYSRPIEAMFYTNITAYSIIPPKQQIIDLLNKGYTVIINDNANIPADIKSIAGIKLEKLSP